MASTGAHAAYNYPTLVLASVTGVFTLDESDPRLLVDLLPVDNHQAIRQIPMMLPPGLARRPRKGMMSGVLYVNGHPRGGVFLGHIFNADSNPHYADPAPTWCLQNVDDLVFYHDETRAFVRIRNVNSTAKQSGPDGSAGQVEVGMASGAALKITEYQEPYAGDKPPAPKRAKSTLDMPQGFNLTIDEPAAGQTTVTLTHPAGTTITIDKDGKVEITAPQVVVNTPSAILGGTSGQELAFKSDVQTLVNQYNAHTHTDPQGATTGVPVSPANNPVGTTNTVAQ